MSDTNPGSQSRDWRPIPDPTTLTTEQLNRAVAAERDYINGQIAVVIERLSAMDKATSVLDNAVHRVPTELQQAISHLDAMLTDRLAGHFLLDTERFHSVAQQFVERDVRLHSEVEDNKTRVDAAFVAAKGEVQQMRALLDEKFVSLTKQFDERFDSIANQFKERDTHSERESRDNKTAVDAAFSAQKEAAAKQDEANSKAIDKSEKSITETINKLEQLFKTSSDGLAGKIDDLKERTSQIESNVNGIIQRGTGGTTAADHFRANVALGISVVLFIITVIGVVAAFIAAKP